MVEERFDLTSPEMRGNSANHKATVPPSDFKLFIHLQGCSGSGIYLVKTGHEAGIDLGWGDNLDKTHREYMQNIGRQ